MTTKYAASYKKAFVDVPAVQVCGAKAKVHCLNDQYVMPTLALANDDIIKIGVLPAGARVVEAIIEMPTGGGTGVVNLGWAASDDAVESADENGFIDGCDCSAGAAIKKMSGDAGNAGMLKQFASPVEVQAQMSAATVATTGTVNVTVFYVID
jgi:hypothetical protein